jgi:hypothetical protein
MNQEAGNLHGETEAYYIIVLGPKSWNQLGKKLNTSSGLSMKSYQGSANCLLALV